MKSSLLLLSLLTVALLPSCEVMDTGYSTGSYYGGGGYVNRPTYYNTYDSDYYDYGYAGRPYGGGYYRGGRYYNGSGVYCPPENYHNHSSHSSSRSSSGSAIKLIRGNDGDHPNRPEGYHSKEWYQKRGYDLSDYTHKHRDGEVHKGDDKKHKH